MKNLLITLSAKIKELNATTMSAQDKWEHLEIHNELLGGTVEMKHFIACGQDGKPITEPVPGDWFDTNKKLSDFSIADTAGFGLYGDKLNDYQEALKSVIFVGFEYVQTGATFYIKNDLWGIDWYSHEHSVGLFPVVEKSFGISRPLEVDPTFAQLSEATKDNPLPIK